ncbi:MAG: N-acetylglucosamine-6-phosphate deacetylase [Candidatus Aminicenantaceae bacterium]
MPKTAFKGNVILPDKVLYGGVVVIEGKKITGVYSHKDELLEKEIDFLDYNDKFISPGLIDLHFHGAMGRDTMDCNTESVEQLAFHQAKCGVTGFLATTTSSSLESVIEAIETVKKTSKLQLPSKLLGVHVEGPFLNKQKRGAQDLDFIREMNDEEIHLLIRTLGNLKAIISIAPEVGDNISFIKSLKEKNIVVSIGHSDATYQQAMASFEEGISHATHLFNAMRKFHPREPGVVGAVFDSPGVTAEIIADGVHLHPSTIRLAVSRKGIDKICLITDSINAAGLGDGIYPLGNLEMEVKGTEARLRESGVLAGSVLTLNRAVRNVIEWTGVEVNQGINMASLNASRVLSMEREIGSIRKGKYADLAIFDKKFNLVETVVEGNSVLKA